MHRILMTGIYLSSLALHASEAFKPNATTELTHDWVSLLQRTEWVGAYGWGKTGLSARGQRMSFEMREPESGYTVVNTSIDLLRTLPIEKRFIGYTLAPTLLALMGVKAKKSGEYESMPLKTLDEATKCKIDHNRLYCQTYLSAAQYNALVGIDRAYQPKIIDPVPSIPSGSMTDRIRNTLVKCKTWQRESPGSIQCAISDAHIDISKNDTASEGYATAFTRTTFTAEDVSETSPALHELSLKAPIQKAFRSNPGKDKVVLDDSTYCLLHANRYGDKWPRDVTCITYLPKSYVQIAQMNYTKAS